MTDIKINLCRLHWQQLPPHCKDRATAKHLIAAVEIAERLIRENNRLEMECRKLRQIASRVPAKIYIEAKEKAGYGEAVNPKAYD